MTEQNLDQTIKELERKKTSLTFLNESISEIDHYLAENREVYANYPGVHAILTAEYTQRRREEYELQREIRLLEA